MVMRAWRRETAGCARTTEQVRSRPTMMLSPLQRVLFVRLGLHVHELPLLRRRAVGGAAPRPASGRMVGV